jgi:hypothetical protein
LSRSMEALRVREGLRVANGDEKGDGISTAGAQEMQKRGLGN